MKIDDYMAMLNKLRQDHGPDLEVMSQRGESGAVKAPLPRIAYMDKEHNRTFWHDGMYDKAKGVKVVRL